MTSETVTPSSEHFLKLLLPPSIHAMLATEQVTEILSLTSHQIIPIPDLAKEVMGVANWRGEVLWLVDLGHLLDGNPLFQQQNAQATYRALVVHHATGYLGLVVNQVNATFWCDAAQIQLLSATQRTSKLSFCLRGYWTDAEGETIWVLDSEAIVKVLNNSSG